jgi:hypothetical protein
MVKFERDGIREMGRGRGMARDNCWCLGFVDWVFVVGKLTLVMLTASPAALAATLDAMVAAVAHVFKRFRVKLLEYRMSLIGCQGEHSTRWPGRWWPWPQSSRAERPGFSRLMNALTTRMKNRNRWVQNSRSHRVGMDHIPLVSVGPGETEGRKLVFVLSEEEKPV